MSIEHRPQILGPNDRPSPLEFDESQVVYVDGGINVPEPEWMKCEAERVARERGAIALRSDLARAENQRRSEAYALRRFGPHPFPGQRA
jgi:hypothetical protein